MGVYIGIKDHVTGEEAPEWYNWDGKWKEFLDIDFEKGGVEFQCFGELPHPMDDDERCWRPKYIDKFYLYALGKVLDKEKLSVMVGILRSNKNYAIWYSY